MNFEVIQFNIFIKHRLHRGSGTSVGAQMFASALRQEWECDINIKL